MTNKNFSKAVAYGSKRSGVPFKTIAANYRKTNAELKGAGKTAQGVIYARQRFRELNSKAVEA